MHCGDQVHELRRQVRYSELLMKLALGRVDSCPFESESTEKLKNETIVILEQHDLSLERTPRDRTDIPIEYRYMGLLLKAAKDPEVGLGDFAAGVRVGSGARLRESRHCIHERKNGDFRVKLTPWIIRRKTT